MARVENDTLHSQMHWRYACKKFDPVKKIREADWKILSETLRLSVSSYGLQPWKFFVVQDQEVRKQLLPLSWGQSPVVEASHFVVLTYKEKMDEEHINKYVEHMAKTREVDPSTLVKMKTTMMKDLITGPRAAVIDQWAQRQTYIAMGSFLTTAALMEIDALPMEGLQPDGYDKVLGLGGTGYKTVAAIACGYRAADDQFSNFKKVRFHAEDVIIYK